MTENYAYVHAQRAFTNDVTSLAKNVILKNVIRQPKPTSGLMAVGIRSFFKIDDSESYSKSALSQHCFNNHSSVMDFLIFKLGFLICCTALDLDKEENRFVTKFRTDVFEIKAIFLVYHN